MDDGRLRGVSLNGRLAAAATLLFASMLAPTTAEAAFGFRKIITVQAGQVASGPHADYPLLVNVVDPDLRTVVPFGGNVTSDSGYDIIFRGEDATTCGGPATCRLEHEIEQYDPSNGTLVAWVRVPSSCVVTVTRLSPSTVVTSRRRGGLSAAAPVAVRVRSG